MNNTDYWIKIFPELTKKLIENDLLTEYVFFGTIKKVHSSIFNYKSEEGVNKMSSIMGCSNSTTRRIIKKLLDLGWATEEFNNSNHLRFESNKKLFAQFKLEENQFGYNTRYVGKATKDIMILSVINQNLEQQEHRFADNLSNFGKDLTKIYKTDKAAAIDVLLNERKVNKFSANSDVTLSRMGISKIANRLSVSSGKNLMDRLSKMGLVESDVCRIAKILNEGNGQCLDVLDKSTYINCKGELWMQLPNKVKFASVMDLNKLIGGLLSGLKKNANVGFKYNASFEENMLELFANMDQRTSEYNYYSQREFSLNKSTKGLEIINKNNPLYLIYLNKSLANKN